MISIKGRLWHLAALFLMVLFNFSCRQTATHLRVVADMNIGESRDIELGNGDVVRLTLLDIDVIYDSLRNAIRAASARISVDGEEVTLSSGNYNLPVVVGKVQIDCPVVGDYVSNSRRNNWGLQADARFRLWPKDSPYLNSGTFVYPIRQAWFASRTQSGNEPSGLGWAEDLKNTSIYYHEGHDIGGAEGMDEIIAATNGLVVSSKGEVLDGYDDFPGDLRPDVIYIEDDYGWFIRYSHFDSIDPEIVPGKRVKMGQRLGLIGKQGGSGGWVHLHFALHHKNPNTSMWEVEDAYAYLWESYVRQYSPAVIAVARPRHLLFTGQEATLDGTKSRSMKGEIVSYQWTFTDGTTAEGPVQKRRYEKAGEYSEILKVTDSRGNVGYDFANLQVYDREFPEKQVPTIHAVYHPSLNLKAGDPITFLVRSYGSNTGDEIWDFGDGTKKTVNSGVVQRASQNQGRYASIVHSFSSPGDYIVKVERTNEHGFTAYGHLFVKISR